jgi:hypothetical protein
VVVERDPLPTPAGQKPPPPSPPGFVKSLESAVTFSTGYRVFHSETLRAKYQTVERLGPARTAGVLRDAIVNTLSFYCSELEGVTMPGFEEIYRQCS